MTNEPRRAPRMSLHLSLRYRRVGEHGWHAAVTQNISRSGLLFRAESDLDPDVMVEIELRLPAVPNLNPAGAFVLGHARIVRKTELTGLDGHARPALAAAFLDYDFSHAAD